MSPTQVELGNYGKPQQEEDKEQAKPFNFVHYLKEVRTEFTKISWPSKEQATKEFFAVLILVAILSGIIFIIDKVLGVIQAFFSGRLY